MPTRPYRLEKGVAGFRYLNQPSASAEPCYALADVDDGEGLRSTLDAMAIVGISEAEREAVLRTVAAVLHLATSLLSVRQTRALPSAALPRRRRSLQWQTSCR